jgi:hypothetical protein
VKIEELGKLHRFNMVSKMVLKTLFPSSKIVIERSYAGKVFLSKEVENLKSSIIPLEAVSALEKLRLGDLKDFAEMYIETLLCTEITSLCKEHGPRIKYSIAKSNDGVEVYSECFDPELLFYVLLGDIADLLHVIVGYRDNVRFKQVTIQKELVSDEFISSIKAKVLGKVIGVNEAATFNEISLRKLIEILSSNPTFTEIIFEIPCISANVTEHIAKTVEVLEMNGKRVYLALSQPSRMNERYCKISYKDLLMGYVKLLEELGTGKSGRVVICYSEPLYVGVIINRSLYLRANTPVFKEDTKLTPVTDTNYVNDYTSLILKHCLCSNNLVKEDLKDIYINSSFSQIL